MLVLRSATDVAVLLNFKLLIPIGRTNVARADSEMAQLLRLASVFDREETEVVRRLRANIQRNDFNYLTKRAMKQAPVFVFSLLFGMLFHTYIYV